MAPAKVAPDVTGDGSSAGPGAKEVRYVLQSPTGRTIEYHVFGRCKEGDPVLIYFNGLHLSGMGPPWKTFYWLRKAKLSVGATSLPWRIIAISRPGYGGSKLNMGVREWCYGDLAKDVAAVADHLGAETFAVMGASSGGPNALAIAAHLPRRVTACLTISGDGSYAPGFPRGKKLNESVPEDSPTYVDGSAMFREGGCCGCCFVGCVCCGRACCQGCCTPCCPKGAAADILVETKPWDFSLKDIVCPVLIYHGDKDTITDPNCSRYHAAHIPHARMIIVPGMKHGIMSPEAFDGMMEELLAASASFSRTQQAPAQLEMEEAPGRPGEPTSPAIVGDDGPRSAALGSAGEATESLGDAATATAVAAVPPQQAGADADLA